MALGLSTNNQNAHYKHPRSEHVYLLHTSTSTHTLCQQMGMQKKEEVMKVKMAIGLRTSSRISRTSKLLVTLLLQKYGITCWIVLM
jgi:hypothetical protein